MALKPEDVRVPVTVQMILDCYWLINVRREGLLRGDKSIVRVKQSLWSNDWINTPLTNPTKNTLEKDEGSSGRNN